jgi:hypothetical protein
MSNRIQKFSYVLLGLVTISAAISGDPQAGGPDFSLRKMFFEDGLWLEQSVVVCEIRRD